MQQAHCSQEYEEVIVPPAKPVPPRVAERLIPVNELDPLARGSFPVSLSFLRRKPVLYSAYEKGVCKPKQSAIDCVSMRLPLQ
jgi:antiviral helicase SLH1